jgi:glyoxylase-like metal-dependent hydrolase (beta-lactamase superfamily II)
MQVNNSLVVPISLGHVSCFLIKGEKNILVDTGIPGSAGKIMEVIQEAGIKPTDISLIIITHGHLDHFGSLTEIKRITGAKIAVQRNAAGFVRTGKNEDVKATGFLSNIISILMSSQMKKNIAGIEIDIVFKDELDLNEYGVKGKVISTPGHTPGSASIILENGETIVGDMIGGKFSNPSAPTIPLFATDLKLLHKSVQKVLSFSPVIIYASHGGPFKTDEVRDRFKE